MGYSMFLKSVNKVYTITFLKKKKSDYKFYSILSYNLVETISPSNYLSKNYSLISVQSTSNSLDTVENLTSSSNQNIDQGLIWIFLFVFAIGLLLASFILEKNENLFPTIAKANRQKENQNKQENIEERL